MKALRTLLACAILTAASPAAIQAQPAATAKIAASPEIVIYHMEGRRSERIVWLCEELGVPYKLVFKSGDLRASGDMIRAVNPLMPAAPTVAVNGQILNESGGIAALIMDRWSNGRLQPAVDSPDYANYLNWMHAAEDSAAQAMTIDYQFALETNKGVRLPSPNNTDRYFTYAEDFLTKHPYFGGKEFSTADIMMLFPIELSIKRNMVDPKKYPKIAAWMIKIQERPAHLRMRAAARPIGWVSPSAPLKDPT